MFRLVYSSDFTIYDVNIYPSVEDCERDCQTRYGVDKLRFGAEDSGVLYSLLYTEEGIVVLTLHEIEVRQ
jgi:hypothetical protein